jgi:hypothetical protein
MTPAIFKKRLREHNFTFSQETHGLGRFTRVVGDTKQHVARDNVRGSAWRLYLAVGEVPEIWPAMNILPPEAQPWIQAESPWFQYFTDLDPSDPLDAQCESREAALEKCFTWLITVGFEWLDDPAAKTLEEWRKGYNILVRNPRVC